MAAERKGEQLKVFISYSRRDAAAADALVEALIARGFDVTIDRRNLPFGEKWLAELAEFIRLSDTVVWLVSEASIQSKWVNWELDEVARRNKRLVPAMIAETARDALPRQLGEIHILPAEGVFDPPRDLDELVRVLETDRAWLKEASRLQDRAHEWLSKSRTSALLLSRGARSDPCLRHDCARPWRDGGATRRRRRDQAHVSEQDRGTQRRDEHRNISKKLHPRGSVAEKDMSVTRMAKAQVFVAILAAAHYCTVVSCASAGEAVIGAVRQARTTEIPACTSFVDAASKGGAGTAQAPHKTMAAAVEAAGSGAVICVAEGTYSEQISPGEKYFTLAGGFQRGSDFKVRDSAKYVTKAQGKGGSFLRIEDPGPKGAALTAIDGFELTGYSQAIVRDYYESQRFDVTNNFIHDNTCADESLAGAGVALNNVSGTIRGNVFSKNACGRGGALFLNDSKNENKVSIENNLVDGNSGTEPTSAHGGALYLFGNMLKITGNLITNNTVAQWGGGLFVGAFTQGNQPTTATLSRNVYRGNRAGNSGGGFFCDDGAKCTAEHEIYDRNCGGNVMVDGGAEGSGPTISKFDHITNVGALTPECDGPGIGFWVNTYDAYAPDTHSITNAIFWGNAPGKDLVATCGLKCGQLKVSVDHSMLDAKPGEGIKINLGPIIVPPSDPLFLAPEQGDFRLQDASPARGKGTTGSDLGASGTGATVPVAPSPAPENVETTMAATKEAQDSAATSATAALARGALKRPVAAAEETAPAAEAAPREVDASPTQTADVSAKEAFEAAKELGTIEAWNAFLESYPQGFHANLARAYIKKLGGPDAPAAPTKNASPEAKAALPAFGGTVAATEPGKPAIARGGKFMSFPEKFNRYYTDPKWKPSRTVFVSPDGGGDGATRKTPMAAKDAVAAAAPGTRIHFNRGKYEGCYELSKETSGTYDDPVVLYGERNEDQATGVSMTCCASGRHTCFNLEGADYVAVDGFEFTAGKYGVRVVGSGYPASQHSRGIAVLGCMGHDQDKDPFFSAQSDWNVWERNVGYGAKKGDGHGIYLSNGSDWNIVRLNETYGNASSDFQINADPNSTCGEDSIPFDDPRCDAYAGEGEGGQGASDYFLVEGNYFHHGLGPGPT